MVCVPPPVINLVVVFGGRSAEHDVSRTTAAHVLRAVSPERYSVTAIGIDTHGEWFQISPDSLDQARSGAVEQVDVVGIPIGVGDLMPAGHVGDGPVVALPLLHGPLGEDGTIQGLFEMANVAYVGSGVLGSALAMDKAMAKLVCAAVGIPQARHVVLHAHDHEANEVEDLCELLGLPAFVKPANMGSSIGVSRVGSVAELRAAIDVAFTYDRIVVVEEAIAGREIEVAVLGNRAPVAFEPGEVVPADTFYSYADKYLDGASTVLIPAELDHDVAQQAKDMAIAAFLTLRCSGLARCDFFYDAGGRGLMLNEINTMPGFTPISMYPKMVLAGGIGYPELIDRLVDLALEEHESKRRRIDHP